MDRREAVVTAAAFLSTGMRERIRQALPNLSPPERARMLALLQEPVAPPLTFRQFVDRVNPRFVWHPHNVIVGRRLQDVADGKLKRLMVFQPPRHGKSEEVTRLFPAYFLYRHPQKWVAIAAYAQELANTFSRNARNYWLVGLGQPPEEVASAVKHWETGQGGGLWASGVGGVATGKGYDLGLIDDPVKNAEEAKSEAYQMRHRDWYDSVFYFRGEPDAAIVVTLTRWDANDLAGYILSKQDDGLGVGDETDHWHVIHMPAIREAVFPPVDGEGQPLYGSNVTLEPDPRQPGEALAPGRYPLTALHKIRNVTTPYFWNALFQQRPTPPEGTMLKREWFPIVDTIPEPILMRVRWWDKAATEGGGDQTAGALVAIGRSKRAYIEDIQAFHHSAGIRDQKIKATTASDAQVRRPPPYIWGEQEPGSAGKDEADAFKRMLAGYPVQTEPSTGDKETAVQPLATAAELGMVSVLRGPWNAAFIKQATAFPHGDLDDQVEAVAKAYSKAAKAQGYDPNDFLNYRR